ncbi:hypothetical protein [Corynebacterium flavescens]|uniref:Uncharacterized protein n=1 Tax=Corynebacterium flavescens TaxID=28028 RepID=A0A1L7CNI6_CORFL|nr:hypothetical protein [Corynebacterium flavescens]APT87389.1 hypothetical protein CFLV_09485 [Corynebacterium flavescens]KAA8720473.1 hypothetical protein F4V60_09245 [Corynebacterium flavescens]GEB97766.1 hypothetical protein CFL01nite_12610 [Corynebacterium flavescens]
MTARGMTPKRRERANKVVALHDGGATFEQIAKQLGVSYQSVRTDYEKAMDETRPEQARQVFQKLDRRLNKLHMVCWNKAMKGDLKAVKLSADICKQIAELWGVNGAIKMDVEVSGGEDFAGLLDSIQREVADSGV